MNANIPNHPCNGKCSEYKEEQCSTCLILAPCCDYCGSDEMVKRTASNNRFICIDCMDELEPVTSFATSDIDVHIARAVIAQGEIS